MNEISKAEQYLLSQISKGDSQAWSQLVEKFNGRMYSYAFSHLGSGDDAQDAVQETFIALIKSISTFKGQASLETFIFSILKRKIIDSFRGRSRHKCLAEDVFSDSSDSSTRSGLDILAADQQPVSWYARSDEEYQGLKTALAAVVNKIVARLTDSMDFKDLKVVELLFYAQLPNNRIIELTGNKNVAVIKHRLIKQIREKLDKLGIRMEVIPDNFEMLLTDLWESNRLSCLKRSTIGGYLLNTLSPEWQDYADFHLNILGCHYCRANLDDLRQLDSEKQTQLRMRVMESTIGFLSRI